MASSVGSADAWKADLMGTAKIENDCIPATGEMKLCGLNADRARWKTVEDLTKEEHVKNISSEAFRQFPWDVNHPDWRFFS